MKRTIAAHGRRASSFEVGRFVVFVIACTNSAAAVAEHAVVCADPRVRIEGKLGQAFVDQVVRLCKTLGSMRDIDDSVRLRIVPADDAVIIEATLPDGRLASRRIHSPDELQRTVEALAVLPPKAPPAPPPKPAAPERSVEEDVPQARTAGSPLAILAGSGLVARLSGAPTYASAGIEAYAGARFDRWLLALTVRFDPAEDLVKNSPSSFEMETVGAGFWFVRRVIRERTHGLDAGVTVAFLSETQSIQSGSNEIGGSSTDVRVGLTTRASFGRPWEFVPSFSAEVSPVRLTRDQRINAALPVLPAWSVALGLGAAWEGQ